MKHAVESKSDRLFNTTFFYIILMLMNMYYEFIPVIEREEERN